MRRETPYERVKAFYSKPEIPKNILYFYIFLFDQRDLDSKQRQKILQFQTQASNQIIPLATSIGQYCQIQEKALKQQHSGKTPKIILVTNILFCEEIIQMKINEGSINQLEEVYLCYKRENQQTRSILNKHNFINKMVHNLDDVIGLSKKHFKSLRQTQEILKNFLMISHKKCKRSSYLIKVRSKGCINLSQHQYEEYKQKFKSYLNKKLTLGKGEYSKQFTAITDGLQTALTLLGQNKFQQFSQSMLQLYQGNVFHAILNNGLMLITDEKFEWRQLALPFSLLYKAIKIRFRQFCLSQQEIQKIFGNQEYRAPHDNGRQIDQEQIILWRGGRISQKELNEIRQYRQIRPFYELSSFASTSLKKEIALGFLNMKNHDQNCLMKIKMKRPKAKKEVERFSFIYQSFAIMTNQRQHQLLLNALTILRLSNNKDSITTRKQMVKGTKVSTTVIQLQVVDIESFIERYLAKDPSLTEYEQQATRHYLMTVDSIQDCQTWDIGDSLRFSGQLTAARSYYTQKLVQLENSQTLTPQQFLANKKSHHQICDKLSDVCLNLNLEKESITYSQLSLSTYSLIEKLDKSKDFKEHHQYMSKKLEKYTFILQIYGHFQLACEAIQDRIRLYQQQIIQKAHLQLAYQFFMAKLLINLGIIWLRQGQYGQAKVYFDQSQQKVNKLLIQIDYQGMKKQTFYFSFLIYFLFSDKSFKQELRPDEYFKIQRAKKINVAAFAFGGQKKLQDVIEKSGSLKDKMEQFIRKQKDKDALPQNKGINQSMLNRVQIQFNSDKAKKELDPQVKDFFKQFKKELRQGDQSQKSKKSKQIYALLIDAAEQSIQNIQIYDNQLTRRKQELIFDKLTQWKSTDHAHKGSALQTKKHLERHVLKLKKTQDANIFKYKVQSRQHYQQYLRSSINLIAEHLKDMRDYDAHHPTLETLNYRFRREELIQRQGDEIQAEAQIERIIRDAKYSQNFVIQSLQAYLLSIKLHFSIADIDFLNFLEEKVQPRKKSLEIEKMQRQFIQKCKEKIECASKLVQKSLRKHQRPMIDMSQEQTLARLQSLLNINDELQKRQLERVKKQRADLLQIDIHLNIWMAKCLIFEYNDQVQYHRFGRQIFIQRCIQNIKQKMNLLHQDSRKIIIHSYLNEIIGLYRYKCKEYQQGLDYLSESFTKVPQYRQIQRNFYIITKVCFMYSKHKFPLQNFTQQLQRSQHFTINYPFNWRICLANHFQNKKTKTKTLAFIIQCMKSLQKLQSQQRPFKDQNLILKHQLLVKFEYEPIKQRYQSIILKYSIATLNTKVQTSYSRVSPPKKVLTRKTSRSIKSLKNINSQILKSEILDLKLLNNYPHNLQHSQQFSSNRIHSIIDMYQSQRPSEKKSMIPKETVRIYSARTRYEDKQREQTAKSPLMARMKQRKQRYLIDSKQKQKKGQSIIALSDISIRLFQK